MIEALKKADDYITAKELMSIVKEKVFIDAKDRGHKQTPDGGTLYGQGDFVFIPNILAKADKSKEALEKAKKEQENLEQELKNLLTIKDENARKQKEEELLLQKKALEQKILSEEMEKKRLEEEMNKKKEQEELAKENYNEAEQQRLEALRKINQMKKEISGTNTILEALEQINKFNNEKKSVENNFNEFVNKTKTYYEKLINEAKNLPKDELETTSEYNDKIKNEISLIEQKRDEDIKRYEESVRNEVLNGLEKSMCQIQERFYSLPVNDYKVAVGKYDADNGFFEVIISIIANNEKYIKESENFKWNIPRDEAKKIISYRDLLICNGYGGIVMGLNSYKIGNFSIKIKDPKEDKDVFNNIDRIMKIALDKKKNENEKQKIKQEFDKWNEKKENKFVLIEGGTFKSTKSNYYGKNVTVSSLIIGMYEVTQKEWIDVMGDNPSIFKGDDLPVEFVNWYDCIEYCNKRSINEGLTPVYTIDKNKKDPDNTCRYDKNKWIVTVDWTADGYRLPTDAEWEYAATGGQESISFTYSGTENIDLVAWYYRNSNEPKSVGTKSPNELGVYDMSGNVWEWCWDWFGDIQTDEIDPKGSVSGDHRVYRGGSWYEEYSNCHISLRNGYMPDYRDNDGDIGFRLCRNAK